MWVGDGAEVLEVGALAVCGVYDGGVFFGRVKCNLVVVAPFVYGGL